MTRSVEMETGDFAIQMDGRWRLSDLRAFSHAFAGAYSFAYVLRAESMLRRSRRRAEDFYSPSPHVEDRGSLSALQRSIRGQRPELIRINYASPGVMELFVILSAAYGVSRFVRHATGTMRQLHELRTQIDADKLRRELRLIQLRERELSITEKEARFLDQNSRDLLVRVSDVPESELPDLAPFAQNPIERYLLIREWVDRVILLSSMQARNLIRLPDDTDSSGDAPDLRLL